MTFIDTNIFLRFFLEDHVTHYEPAKKLLLKAAKGRGQFFTSSVVFLEVYWVLKSHYRKRNPEIKRVLSAMLNMDFLYLEERSVLSKTLTLIDQGFDFADAYNLAYAESFEATEFKTFDKKLAKKFSTI